MTPYVVAGLVVGGIVAVGVWAWYASERAKAEVAAVLATEAVCVECLETPVEVPGGACRGCQRIARDVRAEAQLCPICQTQRVPLRGAPCGVCLHDFHEELDRWGVSS